MATNIPAKIRQAGLAPFAMRGAQLASAEPVISYWCQYWVVNQILAKQLHNADEECLQYTTTLMDNLEQAKVEQVGNDAILDDVAGQAYVEGFALKTFERAMRPLKANKVTRQTADTFQAAATFLELLKIWSQPDPETTKNITFSKWNAARILKAIKEGQDPNASNPQPEEDAQDGAPALDPNDPEVQMLGSGQPKPATVEDATEDEGSQLPPASSHSLQAPVAVSEPTSPLPPTAPAPEQVSPIAPPDVPAQDPGSYFPNAPGPSAHTPLDLPSTTSMPSPGAGTPDIPSPSTHIPSAPSNDPSAPQDFYRPAPASQPPVAPIVPPVAPPQQPRAPVSHAPPNQGYYPAPSQPTIPSVAPAQPTPQHTGTYNYEDAAISQAQKHAKWAISALNFEDVPTAVKELQAALASLGAR
ncbi:Vta1 like-domain-containing protein [Xylariaceae sp. FL0016]|nr:Vta1 like-domain-containing protein [Xylariaceae sp. FL0016]